LEEFQKSGKVLFETTDAHTGFFENIYKKIGTSPNLFLRYSKVMKELKRKLPKTLLSVELLELVTARNRAINESSKGKEASQEGKSDKASEEEGNKEVEGKEAESKA